LGLGIGFGVRPGARHRAARGAVVEEPLVEQREQRVEDGRVGLEDLVDEEQLGLRSVAGGGAPVLVALERGERERPEELLWRREARQRALEVGEAAQA